MISHFERTKMTSEEVELYFKHLERIENILVVLDDSLEVICEPAERLSVVDFILSVLGIEPDTSELWQHLNTKAENETSDS